MPDSPARDSRTARRLPGLAGLVVPGLALAAGGFWLFGRPGAGPGREPPAVIDLVVTDVPSGSPVAGAKVVYEYQTGEYDPRFPLLGACDRAGRIRLTCGFPRPSLKGVGPHERTTRVQIAGDRYGGDAFVIKDAGHREARLPWPDVYAALLDHVGPGVPTFTIPLDRN